MLERFAGFDVEQAQNGRGCSNITRSFTSSVMSWELVLLNANKSVK